MRMFKKILFLIVAGLLFSFGMGAAYGASDYPNKSLTIVCHTGAGAGSDVLARFIVSIIEKYKLFPQPIAVENKPGGSGAIAMSYVAGKKKDPYYLTTVVGGPFITTPVIEGLSVSYRDFTPIRGLLYEDVLLIVNSNSKFKSLQDFVDAAKASPETLIAAGGAKGSEHYLLFRNFERAAGIKMKYVSLGGGGNSIVTLLGGHVDFAFQQPSEVAELRKANKIRVLGVFAEKRLAGMPDIPTLKEQGVNVVNSPAMRGFVAPKDIPEDARKVLEELFVKVAKTEEYKKFVKDNFCIEVMMDGPTFGKWMAEKEVSFKAELDDIGYQYKKN